MQLITGVVQDYAWGSTTEIPRILGHEPSDEPQAEYWLGAHASAPSRTGDGEALDELVARHPDMVGAASRSAFGDRLSYLLKVLAAERPLSLQAHPSREQAEAGFAAENDRGVALDDPTRTFKDPWPKPEMLVALTPFDALCGFRDPAQTAALFDGLGLSHTLDSVIGPLVARGGEAGLAEVFLDALSLDDGRRNVVNETVAAAMRHVDNPGDLGLFARTAVELDEFTPGDPGILAALLLNRVALAPGEAIFLPAGNMHAYLRGTGIEIMANSDNVLRGGLTSKHIDVEALVSVVNFAAEQVELVPTRDEAPGLVRYLTPAPEFALWRADLRVDTPVMVPLDALRIVLVTDGYVAASSSVGETLEVVKGQALMVPAGEQVQLHGDCTAFIAGPGVGLG